MSSSPDWTDTHFVLSNGMFMQQSNVSSTIWQYYTVIAVGWTVKDAVWSAADFWQPCLCNTTREVRTTMCWSCWALHWQCVPLMGSQTQSNALVIVTQQQEAIITKVKFVLRYCSSRCRPLPLIHLSCYVLPTAGPYADAYSARFLTETTVLKVLASVPVGDVALWCRNQYVWVICCLLTYIFFCGGCRGFAAAGQGSRQVYGAFFKLAKINMAQTAMASASHSVSVNGQPKLWQLVMICI